MLTFQFHGKSNDSSLGKAVPIFVFDLKSNVLLPLEIDKLTTTAMTASGDSFPKDDFNSDKSTAGVVSEKKKKNQKDNIVS